MAVDVENEYLTQGPSVKVEGRCLPYLEVISMIEFKILVDRLTMRSEGVRLSVISRFQLAQ